MAGGFSCSLSQIRRVAGYIENQEAHHQKKKMRDEYEDLLLLNGIQYDKAYIFKDPE
jgi:hypothetical protein